MSSARLKNAAACAVHVFSSKRAWIGAALITACIFVPPPARADSTTDSFTVSAHVVSSCEVIASDLDFGDYNPVAAANVDAATSLSVTCTNGTGYNVGLDLGLGAGASTAMRYMVDGGAVHALGYTLYQNAGRTTLWGTTVGSNTRAGAGTGSAATIDVFGRIPMNQAVPSGNYSDTITVSVTW
jgi:spore coat protein U-like protein